jgi:glucose 1-dehydrogenase
MRLEAKTCVITGAAQGIGAACARLFATEGANVVIADIVDEQGAILEKQIVQAGGSAIYVNCDAADAGSISALLDKTLQRFGAIDALVCAAAIAPNTDFLEVTEQELTGVLALNVVGPFLLGQAVARHLVAGQKSGSIVNITSTSAYQSGPGQTSYCTSKAGLGGLTRTMAVALAPHKIRVNAVAPGPTKTTLMSDAIARNPDVVKPILARTPLGLAEPEEIAAAVLFLVSDESSFVTGETINVDGGRLALNYTVPVDSQK